MTEFKRGDRVRILECAHNTSKHTGAVGTYSYPEPAGHSIDLGEIDGWGDEICTATRLEHADNTVLDLKINDKVTLLAGAGHVYVVRGFTAKNAVVSYEDTPDVEHLVDRSRLVPCAPPQWEKDTHVVNFDATGQCLAEEVEAVNSVPEIKKFEPGDSVQMVFPLAPGKNKKYTIKFAGEEWAVVETPEGTETTLLLKRLEHVPVPKFEKGHYYQRKAEEDTPGISVWKVEHVYPNGNATAWSFDGSWRIRGGTLWEDDRDLYNEVTPEGKPL